MGTLLSRLEKFAFLKVELWITLLVVLIGSLLTLSFGASVKHAVEEGEQDSLALQVASIPSNIKTLASSGVEVSSEGLVQRSGQILDFTDYEGLIMVDPSFEETGKLLISAYSTEHKIATAYLYDLATQEKLWEWVPPYDEIVENTEALKEDLRKHGAVQGTNHRSAFRTQHPLLLPQGDLIFTSGEGPLTRITKDSELVWTKNRNYHHSLHFSNEGGLVVPHVQDIWRDKTAEEKSVYFREDGFTFMTLDGETVRDYSIYEILKNNGYEGLLFGVGEWETDSIHLNDAEEVRYSDEYVRKGDVMISCRHISTVMLYRPSTDEIVWIGVGPWANQHDVDYLGKGRFSIFGNDSVRGRGWVDYEHSNVYIYDMKDGSISKPYEQVFQEHNFRTRSQGLQRVLENGDAVVELTDAGQIVRISQDKVRWKYVHSLGPGEIGALHWSRYFAPGELDLQWLEDQAITQSN